MEAVSWAFERTERVDLGLDLPGYQPRVRGTWAAK